MVRTEILDRICRAGAVAILRMKDTERLLPVAEALMEGGVTALEVTLTTPGALRGIEELARRVPKGTVIGVGSVLDAVAARRAIDCGAQFVVSPVLSAEVIAAAHGRDCPVMPGAFTPTEAQQASELGADIIKIFPAKILGISFMSAILAPLPHLKLMPTGGVTPSTAGDWIRAGACVVGVGGALVDSAVFADGRYDVITARARALRRSLEEARS